MSGSPGRAENTVGYVEDLLGADVERDLLRMELVSQAITLEVESASGTTVSSNISEVGGQSQSAVDIAAKIDAIEEALVSVGSDEIRATLTGTNEVGVLDSGSNRIDPLADGVAQSVANDEVRTRLFGVDNGSNLAAVQAEEIDTALNGTETGIVTALARALTEVGGTSVQTNLQDTGITQPTDIQDSLEKSSTSYGQNVDTQYQDELQIDGYATVNVIYNGTTTDVLVEKSWDQTNYFQVDDTNSTGNFDKTFTNVAAKYIRVTITGTGGSGDTGDVVIGASL